MPRALGARARRAKTANVEQVVRFTIEETPEGATHWSTRSLAARLGISASTVARIRRAQGLKPHRVESFKLSNDPRFIEKLEDIVGLYLDPPEHATRWCCAAMRRRRFRRSTARSPVCRSSAGAAQR
ncbi:hypothetical protein [Thiomonas sp.]|uniref:hypothetical protein n=1 Tax=Thiomonas sp. TaxID=2047785 RepID=UPI0039B923DA